jgi:signal transduction histidine kinase
VAKTLHGLALAADALARTTDPAAARAGAALVAESACRAAAESRALLTDLRSEGDTGPEVRLPDELRRVAADGAELTTRGPLPPVPAPVASHLLAIVSEALENARRHAAASRVTLAAAAEDGRLVLTVEDDGRGLPGSQPGPDVVSLRRTGHFGLLGMTERAAAIGARLRVGPRPAGAPGTLVRLDLPLAALTPQPEGSPSWHRSAS